MEAECIGVVYGQIFFESMDCVSMVLNDALEVGLLGVLRGMVVGAILVSGCTIFLRVGRLYFAQYYMCRVLQDFGNCGICSVSKRLRGRFAVMKLCEFTDGGCDFGNCFSECRRVSVFNL